MKRCAESSDQYYNNEGSNIDEQFQTELKKSPSDALKFAIKNCSLNHIELAKKAGANINEIVDGGTHLHAAAMLIDYGMMKRISRTEAIKRINVLLDAGADVNALDNHKKTALEFVLFNYPEPILEIAQVLSKRGANLDQIQNLVDVALKIDPTRAKLLDAQTKKSKKYINPYIETVIDGKEVSQYLSILQSAKKPINEIVSIKLHGHWSAAQIKIDDKNVKVLILDSLGGVDKDKLIEPDEVTLYREIPKIFPNHDITFYTLNSQRQKNKHTCYEFTRGDVKDIYKIGNYLPKEYEGELFSYLDKKVNQTGSVFQLGGPETIIVKPPIRMMRGMQTDDYSTIFKKYSQDELDLPVNKKKETSPHTITNESRLEYTKLKNLRCDRKLKKHLGKFIEYLKDTSIEEINEEKEEFTLTGLQKRLKKS